MKKSVYILLSVLVFIYLLLRAIYVPLVHDEIATFFYYIQQLDVNPLAGANPDANNHILNSLLAGISHKLFGYSALSIRLPNLLSFVFYAFFVYQIGQFLSKKWTQITFYLSLLLAVYFVQFFALSRGYGMSMAFLFGAFYYVMKLYSQPKTHYIALGLLFSILAVFANMSLLPLVLLLAIAMKILVLPNIRQFKLRDYLVTVPSALIWITGIYTAIKISFKMKEEGSLYYGELDGFWAITVKSQLLMLFENDSLYPQAILVVGLLVLAMLSFNLFVTHGFNSIINRNFFFFYLLVGSVIGIQLMAFVIHVNYPEDRVGMYLVPLFIGAFCFAVDTLPGERLQVLLIPFLVFPFHFVLTLNVEKSSLWQVEFIPERFYEEIKYTPTQTPYQATVGGDGQRIFTYTQKLYSDTVSPKSNMMQLWQKTLFDSNLTIKLPNHPAQYFDYLISKPEYVKAILPLFDSVDYAPMAEFRLYKRKQPAKKVKLIEFKTPLKNESSDEFIEFYHQRFDSVQYDALMIGMQVQLQALHHPFRARIAVEVRDFATGDKLDYQFYQLNWMYPEMKKEEVINQSMIFNNLRYYTQKGPIEIVCYLWNIRQQPYTLYSAKVEEFGVYD